MTTPDAAAPAHPWRAERTWIEHHPAPQGAVMVASTHTWPTELEARAGVVRLAAGRDLPEGAATVEVVLCQWDSRVRGWRTVDTFTGAEEVSR